MRIGAAVALALALAACSSTTHLAAARRPVPAGLPAATSTTTSTTDVPTMAWRGPIEHMFFHTLVIHPALAFTHDRLGRQFADYFVTVEEFRTILDQLYANGWTLVDIHSATSGSARVPVGRKPLVISEDDVNYYRYQDGRGLASRLVLDRTGAVMAEADGQVTDQDLVPLIDEFVTAHPLFSADGAKGVLAVTGYEGLFGERVQDPRSPGYESAVARATALAARLRATGWTIASHSWGHINLTRSGTAWARQDTERWLSEATPIVGPTDVYVYPFGGSPPPGVIAMLRDHGFSVLCDIDTVAHSRTVLGVTVMSRRHIDGIAFRDQAVNLAPFFSVAAVEDRTGRRLG